MCSIRFIKIVIINLIILEILLRIVGLSFLYLQISNSFFNSQDASSPNVLVLGESTSAGYTPDCWPRQLESKIHSRGLKVNVVNVAEPGTTTSFLIQKIQQQIETYKPKVVISMMGINDYSTNFYFKQGLIQNSNFFLNLKFVKLIKVIYFYLRSLFSSTNNKEVKFERLIMSNEIKQDLKSHDFSAAHTKINLFLKGTSEQQKINYYEQLLNVIAMELPMSKVRHENDAKDSLKILGDSLPIAHKSYSLTDFLLYQYAILKRVDLCKILGEQLIKNADSILPSDSTVQKLFDCLPSNDSTLLAFRDRFWPNIEITKTRENPIKKNYQYFYNLFKSQNICWIIVQYPLQDFNQMKNYFSDSQRTDPAIGFVSNEENFKNYLSQHEESEVFIDHFGGNFGHTSKKGHELIAEQVEPKLIEMLNSSTCGYD